MKTILLFSLLAAPLLFTQCKETRKDAAKAVGSIGDVGFARNTFESLTRGDSEVAAKIDWPVFTSLGENLGTTYVAFPTDLEREKFVTGYITQFATSFRESGGNVDDFHNWRVISHDSQKTEVAADGKTGVLTIVVSERDKVEKVSSLSMVK